MTKPKDFLNQIKNNVVTLEFARRRQDFFKTHLNHVKKNNKSEEQKKYQIIFILFAMHENILLICLMNLLRLCLRLHMKQ